MEFVIPESPKAIRLEDTLTEKQKMVLYGGGKYASVSSIKDDEIETNDNQGDKPNDAGV